MFYCCACISNQKFLKSFISLYTKWSYRDYIVIMDKSMFHKVCMVLVQAHPNNFTNKCQCIPRLHTDSFRQRNNKTNQHNLQPHVVKIVGVTGKISKWHLEKQAPKVLSKFLHQNASVSDTEVHQRELSLLFAYFSPWTAREKTVSEWKCKLTG